MTSLTSKKLGKGVIEVNTMYGIAFVFSSSLFVLHNVNTSIGNGISYFKIQLIWMTFAAIVCVPLTYVMVQITGSWIGVVVANSISLLPYEVLAPIYTFKQLDMYRWIIGAVGCVFIYSAIYLLMPYLGRYKKVISILTSLGTTSLGIYIFQRIIIELFLLDFIKKQTFFIPWYGMILEIFIVTVVCWTLTKLTQKNRILKLLLLGGR